MWFCLVGLHTEWLLYQTVDQGHFKHLVPVPAACTSHADTRVYTGVLEMEYSKRSLLQPHWQVSTSTPACRFSFNNVYLDSLNNIWSSTSLYVISRQKVILISHNP